MNFSRIFIIISAFFLIAVTKANAQFSISDNIKDKGNIEVPTIDLKAPTYLGLEHQNEAYKRAERRRIRNQRNYFEFSPSFNLTQTNFENWATGGDNTLGGRAALFIKHKYSRDPYSLEHWFNAAYGINVIDNEPFKNEDRFQYQMQIKRKINQGWSYTLTTNYYSQFTNGYRSRKDSTLVSAFMAPGVIEIGPGFSYKRKDSPFEITINPLSVRGLFALNKELSDAGRVGGVKKGKKMKIDVGSSLIMVYDKWFLKKKLHYWFAFNSFYDFKHAPTATWNNKVDYKITKFLTLGGSWYMIYNKKAKTAAMKNPLQITYTYGINLAYTMKNKEKPQ